MDVLVLKLALYQSPDPIFHEAMSNSLRTVHESLETLYSMPLLPKKTPKAIEWVRETAVAVSSLHDGFVLRSWDLIGQWGSSASETWRD